MNLVIPSEIYVRDFDQRLYFSLYASKFFNVYIGEQQEILKYIYRLNPGIYFDKSISINKKKLFSRLKSIGWIVVSVDEEGLALYSNTFKYLNHRINEKNLKQIDSFFTWSKKEKNEIIKKYPKFSNKVLCTGNLRFDYLKFLSNKLNYKKNNNVLISSSLVGNHRLGEDGLRDLFKRLNRLNSENEIFEFYSKRNKIKLASKKFHNFVKKICLNNSNYNFIIRPHPAENPESFIKLSSQIKNLNVQFPDEPIHNNFNNILCLIHSGCTTALEAFSYGIKTYYYEADESYNLFQDISYKVDDNLKIESILKNAKKHSKILNNYSRNNTVNHILDNLKKFKYLRINKISILKSYAYFIFKFFSFENKIDIHKFPDLNKKEIYSKISFLNQNNKIKIKFINNKIIKVSE